MTSNNAQIQGGRQSMHGIQIECWRVRVTAVEDFCREGQLTILRMNTCPRPEWPKGNGGA